MDLKVTNYSGELKRLPIGSGSPSTTNSLTRSHAGKNSLTRSHAGKQTNACLASDFNWVIFKFHELTGIESYFQACLNVKCVHWEIYRYLTVFE